MTIAKSETNVQAIESPLAKTDSSIFVTPAGFPDAEKIRKNVEAFLKRGTTRVQHLIMLIHDEKNGPA